MASILVVDDEPGVCASLEMSLEGSGHRVVCTTHSQEVAGLLAKGSFDLVITDILMPDRDGIEVIQELRRKFPKIGIIAMSGATSRSRDMYLETGALLGADAKLPKPFDQEELFASINKALARVAARKAPN